MYKSILEIKETQKAIKSCKDFFERELAAALNLVRVSAPLFVTPESGLNDALNGVERPVEFDLLETGKNVQIVQSLAKWKRYALGKYKFDVGEGLYTDMNAIRRDEKTDAIHSIYVDQWDWEKVISKEQRTVETLKDTVRAIYATLKNTEKYMVTEYPALADAYAKNPLPDEIYFVTTQELEDMYPEMTGKEREHTISREKGAVCIMQIGGKLKSGNKHDGRSPDYDDWTMNCDILRGCNKRDGIIHAIRTLSPEIIICDEISTSEEVEKISEGFHTGVRFIVSVHISSADDLYKRKVSSKLIESGCFDTIIMLDSSENAGKIKEVICTEK